MAQRRKIDPLADHDRREAGRLPVRFVATVAGETGGAVPVWVLDVSRLGFMARCDAALRPGSVATFTAPNGEAFRAEIRWAREDRIGCRFPQALSWEDLLGLGLDELGCEDVPGPDGPRAGALSG